MERSDDGRRLASRGRRLVIAADAALIVEALRALRMVLSKSGELTLVGLADVRRTSAARIIGARPDVILLDDMDGSPRALELIRELKAEDERVCVIILSGDMRQERLERMFDAGATGAISTATSPAVLATLVREALSGHVYYKLTNTRTVTGHVEDASAGGGLPLTTRELEILQLVAAGSTNGEVARKLWVTEQTVKFHLGKIYRKLDVANRTEASHFAHVNGLVHVPAALPVAS